MEKLSTKYIFLEVKSEKCFVAESTFFKIRDKKGEKALKNRLIHEKVVFKEDT